jgi:hypothetical protein
MDERQVRTQLSFFTGYVYKLKKISFQFMGGIALNTLQSATSSLHFQEINEATGEIISKEQLNFSNTYHRSKYDYRPMLMIRANFHSPKKLALNLFARYEWGTQNMTANRYSDPAQMINLQWVEDDFRANFLTLGVGISWFRFKIKKHD